MEQREQKKLDEFFWWWYSKKCGGLCRGVEHSKKPETSTVLGFLFVFICLSESYEGETFG